MAWFSRSPVVPVLRFHGPIGMATPLRPGLSITAVAAGIERAFRMKNAPAVAIAVNSPGGSPVQSHLIMRRIRALAEETGKPVYAFCEDVAASGGYLLALAGDEIYADESSIVGSIGVITAGFGLDRLIEKAGIERRVYTAGAHKMSLDPFQPEKAEDVERLKAIQRDVHDGFIALVRERRGGRLKGEAAELFSGDIWSGRGAVANGLVDGIADVRGKMRELHGAKIRLELVSFERGWLRRRLGLAGLGGEEMRAGLVGPHGLAGDIVSAIEARALWNRFGL